MATYEVIVVIFRQGLSCGGVDIRFELLLRFVRDLHFGGLQSHRLDKVQGIVTRQLASQPEERLFKVVVRLGGDIVVLQVLFAVEGDLLRLYLAVFDFDFVPREHNRNVFTDTSQVTVPVGDILIRDTRRDIKHDDGALSLDVVSITETSKLLLSRRVPDVEFDRSAIGVKHQGMDLHTERGNVLLLKLSRQVTLDEGGLSDSTVSDEDEFEFGHLLLIGRLR